MPESFAQDQTLSTISDSDNQNSPEQEEALILKASLGLFATQGYLNTSMGDIRQGAQLNSRTLYRHFKTKEVIFESLYSNILSSLEQSFASLDKETKKSSDRLYSIVEFFFHLAETTPEAVQFIFQVNHHHILPTRKALYDSAAFESLRHFIKAGMKEGEIKRMDIDLAYALFFGPVFQCVQLLATKQLEDHSIERLIGQTWRSAWRMIAAHNTPV